MMQEFLIVISLYSLVISALPAITRRYFSVFLMILHAVSMHSANSGFSNQPLWDYLFEVTTSLGVLIYMATSIRGYFIGITLIEYFCTLLAFVGPLFAIETVPVIGCIFSTICMPLMAYNHFVRVKQNAFLLAFLGVLVSVFHATAMILPWIISTKLIIYVIWNALLYCVFLPITFVIKKMKLCE